MVVVAVVVVVVLADVVFFAGAAPCLEKGEGQRAPSIIEYDGIVPGMVIVAPPGLCGVEQEDVGGVVRLACRLSSSGVPLSFRGAGPLAQ